jgi:predicted GNAT family N-acyltransferase
MDQEPGYRVEPLESHHDRAAFSCGVVELDRYFHHQAGQDRKRDLAVAFILTSDGKTIAGFYTLSQHSIQIADLPEGQAKKLPPLPIGVTLLGRMAMSQGLQGQGLGEFLLMDALKRAWILSQQIASWAVVVDAKAGAREFYLKYEFVPMPSNPDRLFLTMKTIKRLFF